MAINENNGNVNAQPSMGAGPAPQHERDIAAAFTPWSFHQEGLLSTPVAGGAGSEYFTKVRNALAEIFKDIAPSVDIRLIGLTPQNYPALKVSAIVVAARINQEKTKPFVGFHVLMLEGASMKLKPVTRTIDNQPVRVNRVIGDAYDDVLYRIAEEAVKETFPGSHVYSAAAEVLPASVTPDRKEVLESVARNAAMACVSEIFKASNQFGELNLAQMDRDLRLVMDVAFGNHVVTDIVGAPQRSSVLINYSSVKKTQNSINNQDIVNVADDVAQICELSGFVNPIWAPLEPQGSFGFGSYMNPNAPVATQKFVAEFVMTSVRTEKATSLPAVLLALSSFLTLVDNDTWIQAFIPKPNSMGGEDKRVDITDIGALNIPANIARETENGGFGTPVDIKKMKGDLTAINGYLVSIFRPGVVISLDCPEVGPSSWYLGVFAAAASGDSVARMQIIDAANELTNNRFSQYFKDNDPMFTNIVRVPLGHYMVNGELQDIRNIDYTAIANLYANNPTVIHDYSNTFVERPGVSATRNQAIREGIIMHALSEQAEITGYAARVSLSQAFVEALSAALADLNLPVQVNTPLNADQLRTGVAAPAFVSNSLSHNTRTFQSQYQRQAARGYRYGMGSYGR
jgi:hypothetical protein